MSAGEFEDTASDLFHLHPACTKELCAFQFFREMTKKKIIPTAAERARWSFYDSLEAAGPTKRPVAICSLTSSHT